MMLTSRGAAGPVEVAVVPFFGGEPHAIERDVSDALAAEGWAVVPGPPLPAEAVGCDEQPIPTSCEAPTVERWRAEPTNARFLVLGSVVPAVGGPAVEVRIFDRELAEGSPTTVLQARMRQGDVVLPVVFPTAVSGAIAERIEPPPPPTEAELDAMARLDDPPAAPLDPCEVGFCCRYPAPAPPPDPSELTLDDIDLRDEFETICRVGPPRGPRWVGDPEDLRPICRRGPVWGYVRPRTWAVGSLFVASSGATALAFGLRAAGWHAGGLQLGGHRLGAPLTTWGTAAAITTGALAVSTLVLALSDRRRARRFILRKKRASSLE